MTTTQAGGPTRRDIVRAAGLGIGAAIAGGTALAEPAAVSGGSDTLWSGEYRAKKGEVSLYLYRKRLAAPKAGDKPLPVLFLVHGSSISARSTFDLTVPGAGEYSLMNVFARAGFDVWTMDHEGYGRSSRTDGNSDIASGVEDLTAAGRPSSISSANPRARCVPAPSPWCSPTASSGSCSRPSPGPARARPRSASAPSRSNTTARTIGGRAIAT